MKKNIMLVVRNIRSMKKWYDIQGLKSKGVDKKEIQSILGVCGRTVQRLWDKKFEDWNVDELLKYLPKDDKYNNERDILSTVINKPFDEDNINIEEKYNIFMDSIIKSKTKEEIKRSDNETRKFVDMVRANFIKKYPYYDMSGILKSMKS